MFEAKMEEWVVKCRTAPASASGQRRRILADKEKAVRYANRKMTKRLKERKGPKAAHFRECLLQMANSNDNTSFFEHTRMDKEYGWGDIFYINDV